MFPFLNGDTNQNAGQHVTDNCIDAEMHFICLAVALKEYVRNNNESKHVTTNLSNFLEPLRLYGRNELN